MSIGFLLFGVIIGWLVTKLIMWEGFPLYRKLDEKYNYKKVKRLCTVIPIIVAILFGLIMGYAGGTRVKEGSYPNHWCGVCGARVNQGYKVNDTFGTYYYCEDHSDMVSHHIDGFKSSKSNKKTDTYGHDEYDAEVIAEKIVKGQLKSPSTAKFCEHKEYTISVSGNTWTVSGYVDAQNSFGATLRNTFTVKFTFTSSERYTTDSCTIK